MDTVLNITASPRGDRSLSRKLASSFMTALSGAAPDLRVLDRDIGRVPPPHITEAWIAAAFSEPSTRTEDISATLALSDELVEEVLEADLLVVSAPMHNYGMPSCLKAWVDHVIRINRTFSFDLARGEHPIEPIQSGKTLVTLTSSGEGYFSPGERNAADNHLAPHLEGALRLVGVTRTHRIGVEFQEFEDDRHKASVRDAHDGARQLATEIAAARRARTAT